MDSPTLQVRTKLDYSTQLNRELSAVKSSFTNWCCQKLSKHALNALTVQASVTKLGKLFQIFSMCAEKKTSAPISFSLAVNLFFLILTSTNNHGDWTEKYF